MTWYSIMGLISCIALLLPIFLVLVLRLGSYKSFPALLAYYIPVLIYNLITEGYIQTDSGIARFIGLGNNVIDAPLMLLFLTYFSTSDTFSKRLRLYIAAFIVFEIITLVTFGYNTKAITLILGPGLLSVFGLSLYLFYKFSKIAIVNRKAAGKTIMLASLIFMYGTFGIIYTLYYIFKTREVADTFLIYFLATTIASLTMCTGIIFERKRIQKLLEMKQVRKELSDVYKGEKRNVPLRTMPMLDFDRELWN